MNRLAGVVQLDGRSQPEIASCTSTYEEVGSMTEAQGVQGFKTIGVKLPDDIHAQLVLIAGLDGQSLTDAIRAAIDYFIERKKGEGDMAARAAQALEEIEREAAQRRGALQALFGDHAQAATEASTSRRRRSEQTS